MMRLGSGPTLMHRANEVYDPIKAHEYYLRVRQLKGRRPGSADQSSSNGSGVLKKDPAQLQTQRRKAAARVETLQNKLNELKTALREKEQKAREADKPETAADKSKKARESKKYRDTHKQELKTKAKKEAAKDGGGGSSSAGSDTDKKGGGTKSVAQLKAAISRVEQALQSAKARQRALG